eukprot:7038745-Pyramimonas_sp.AAC.3
MLAIPLNLPSCSSGRPLDLLKAGAPWTPIPYILELTRPAEGKNNSFSRPLPLHAHLVTHVCSRAPQLELTLLQSAGNLSEVPGEWRGTERERQEEHWGWRERRRTRGWMVGRREVGWKEGGTREARREVAGKRDGWRLEGGLR